MTSSNGGQPQAEYKVERVRDDLLKITVSKQGNVYHWFLRIVSEEALEEEEAARRRTPSLVAV